MSVLCALGVAVLWGGNISAIYPIVEMVMNRQSAHEWVDGEIAETEEEIRKLQQTFESVGVSKDELSATRQKLQAERRALQFYRNLAPWISRYAPDSAFSTLWIVCVFILVGSLLKNVFRVFGQILVARLANITSYELRKEFYRRTLRLDLGRFDEKGRGDLMTRFTTDLQYITNGVQTLFGSAVREPLKAVVCLAGAAWISWRLLLLTLVVAPLAAYAIGRLTKLLKRANRKALQELSGIYDTLSETFAGMKLIKAFTMESQQRQQFHRSAKQYFHKSMKIARYDALVSPITEMLGMTMVVLAILAGGYLAIYRETAIFGIVVTSRRLDAGDLMLFFGFLAGVSDPARRLSSLFGALQKASAASDRLFELMDREPSIADPQVPTPLPQGPCKLHFENISFAYQDNFPVLSEVSLTIDAGEAVAIVGPNGCGKSTLLSLVPRLYDPTAGRVRIGDVDIRDARLSDLRRRIGIVSQETLLLNETVAANIRFGAPGAGEADIIAAAKQAHAHQFITKKLADGYDTVVGPGGNRLSGGQRQRIALARAILRDPQILILDEATSQVDVQSEQIIHEVLQTFVRGRTTLIISHRTSTLQLADRVVVMQVGRILDVGTTSELRQRCELFRHLCNSKLRESA